MYRISKGNTAEYLLGPWAHNLRICKTKGVRTFGSTAAEIVCRGATLNTLSSFGFNCVYYALERVVQITETSADLTLASVVVISGSATNHHSAYGVHLRC